RLCIEARTTTDLERSLGMLGGDIFHGGLSWPWREGNGGGRGAGAGGGTGAAEGAVAAGAGGSGFGPAERWGVETAHAR
ncbi:hypothetical protein, partial [Escherichia coli]|uniref:hypothetical protein n=1 Tax=Escherichia coli TaxID=562 RepID=UPI003CE52193